MTIRRTKLVCTLGPACDSLDGLKQLIDAGMDVARFNFSHGTHEEHASRLQRLRAACAEKKRHVAVLQDLCGPKIRTGKFPARFDLPAGVDVVLVEGNASDDERVLTDTIARNPGHKAKAIATALGCTPRDLRDAFLTLEKAGAVHPTSTHPPPT